MINVLIAVVAAAPNFNGWLVLEFAGGSATFTGNETLASVNSMSQLHNVAKVEYDNGTL